MEARLGLGVGALEHDLAVALGIGLTSTAGQWVVVMAFRQADASVLAPFSYVQLVWVTLIGVFVFGELPDLWTFVGAAVIANIEALRAGKVPACCANPEAVGRR